jgi:hypothetical protein
VSGAAFGVEGGTCARNGPIFGDHDYRDQLKKAAAKVLPPEKAKTFTAYDRCAAKSKRLALSGIRWAA